MYEYTLDIDWISMDFLDIASHEALAATAGSSHVEIPFTGGSTPSACRWKKPRDLRIQVLLTRC